MRLQLHHFLSKVVKFYALALCAVVVPRCSVRDAAEAKVKKFLFLEKKKTRKIALAGSCNFALAVIHFFCANHLHTYIFFSTRKNCKSRAKIQFLFSTHNKVEKPTVQILPINKLDCLAFDWVSLRVL